MIMKHKFRRFLQKIAIGMSKKMDMARIENLDNSRECLMICNKVITNPESELVVSPLTGKMYIKNDEQEILITLQGRTAQIINHIYSYTIQIDEKNWGKILTTFNTEKEKRCIDFENSAKVNIKHSLKNILNKLN